MDIILIFFYFSFYFFFFFFWVMFTIIDTIWTYCLLVCIVFNVNYDFSVGVCQIVH